VTLVPASRRIRNTVADYAGAEMLSSATLTMRAAMMRFIVEFLFQC
jgi:hypothetical protein